MKLLIAVAEDLALFALGVLKGLVNVYRAPRATRDNSPVRAEEVIYTMPRPERIGIEAPHQELRDESKLPHAHLDTVFEPVITAPQRNTVVYVSTAHAPLRNSPQRGVDNVLLRMPYGSMLVAMETTGEWVRVFYRGTEGYVELHDLADRAAYVYPKFVISEANTAHDPNTERVRAMIDDEYSYGEAAAHLQAEEYVTYKLLRNGIVIAWGAGRPRTPGTWKTHAAHIKGAVCMSEPAPRTVMEWVVDTTMKHVAFVESVYPDGAIQISEANWPEQGIYNERVMVQEEWQKLSPTFIQFS